MRSGSRAVSCSTRALQDRRQSILYDLIRFGARAGRLPRFSEIRQAWVWDVGQIASRGFTDNVVDLMVAKLSQLPDNVQLALKQLACLGNSATVATWVRLAGPQESLHSALWEATSVEFVVSGEDWYSFTHDRIQEAAYRLIPDKDRSPIHLRIGRVLAATSTKGREASSSSRSLANSIARLT